MTASPSPLAPGADALLFFGRPVRVRAVRVSRAWRSAAGTERVEVIGTHENGRPIRPGSTFDRRQLLSLAALETLSAAAAPGSPAAPGQVAEAPAAEPSPV